MTAIVTVGELDRTGSSGYRSPFSMRVIYRCVASRRGKETT